jgi:hypothetical protein
MVIEPINSTLKDDGDRERGPSDKFKLTVIRVRNHGVTREYRGVTPWLVPEIHAETNRKLLAGRLAKSLWGAGVVKNRCVGVTE